MILYSIPYEYIKKRTIKYGNLLLPLKFYWESYLPYINFNLLRSPWRANLKTNLQMCCDYEISQINIMTSKALLFSLFLFSTLCLAFLFWQMLNQVPQQWAQFLKDLQLIINWETTSLHQILLISSGTSLHAFKKELRNA